jgi:glucokinase
VVLVNGIPGSGKSTLCAALGPELEFPVLSKDVVKESLFDSLGIVDRAWSQQIGRASAGVLWALVPKMTGPVLLDNNVSPDTRPFFAEDSRNAGVERIVEVWCDIPVDLAFARYAARVGASRHPGHCDETLAAEGVERWAPQNIPAELGPVLRVRTDRAVDIPAVAKWVRGQLGMV